MPGLYIIRV